MRAKLAIVACTAIAALAVGSAAHGTPAAPANPTLVVKLKPKNSSGVSATATLTRVRGKIRVVVKLNKPVGGSLPTHLHIGLCSIDPNFNIREGLKNVVKGRSVTITSTTWAALQKGRHSIHVHKAGYVPTVIACGDVPRPS